MSHSSSITSRQPLLPELSSVVKRQQRRVRLLLLQVPIIWWLVVFCMFSASTTCISAAALVQRQDSESSKYFYFCDISRRQIVTLRWNATVGEYQEEDGNSDNEGNLRRLFQYQQPQQQPRNNNDDKKLQQLSWNDFDLNSLQEAMPTNNRRFSEEENGAAGNNIENTTDDDNARGGDRPMTIKARICPCAESHPAYPNHKYYCETDRSYCAVPGAYPPAAPAGGGGDGDVYVVMPVCLNLQSDEIFVRSVWPIILIWFTLALVFCLCTYPGQNAIDYLISTCFPCYNKRVVDSILLQSSRNNPSNNNNNNDMALLSRHAYQRRRHLEERYRILVREHRVVDGSLELAERRLFEYQLKTRRYRIARVPPKDDDNDENDTRAAAPELAGPEATNATTTTAAAAAKSPNNTEITSNPTDEASPSQSSFTENNIDNNDDDNDEADELEHACTICFVPLEDGDRVGALPCQHAFHVDCLKGWLKRRNVCPLCMQGNIATPRVSMAFPIMDDTQHNTLD